MPKIKTHKGALKRGLEVKKKKRIKKNSYISKDKRENNLNLLNSEGDKKYE